MGAFLEGLLTVVYVVVSILLVVMVLLQEPRTGGLSTAFGGSGIDTMLGAGIGRKMSRMTIILAAILLVLAVVLGRWAITG